VTNLVATTVRTGPMPPRPRRGESGYCRCRECYTVTQRRLEERGPAPPLKGDELSKPRDEFWQQVRDRSRG
jgi:hypothetical protein